MKKLSYNYLEKIGASYPGLKFWLKYFDEDEYTVLETLTKIEKDKIEIKYGFVRWIISCCPFCQTPEMVNFYLKMNEDDYYDLSKLIVNCPVYQTPEMVNIYLKMNEKDYYDLGFLITDYSCFQIPEAIGKYLKMKPDKKNVTEFINNCKYTKNHPLIKEYMKKKFEEEI